MNAWMRTRGTGVVLLFLLHLSTPSRADERDFSGVVTRVFDGDSFLVVSARRGAMEVRLMAIDAPEKDQPHADIARSALRALIDGRRVYVDVVEIDKFARKVAKVYREPDRLDIIHVLVREGHVWVNRKYTNDRELIALEELAQSRTAGLWALPASERLPPWTFRNRNVH